MHPSELPEGFESLEAFVPMWGINGTATRAQRRHDSSRDQREAFYAAAREKQAAALELLDRKSLGALDANERRLMNLMLSFAHVSLAVEVQGPEEERHRQMSRHMTITRSVADR